MKANRKRLKATLALGIKKLRPAFLASKLGDFPLFDGFLDLADFLLFEFPDLHNFGPFDNFSDFLASSLSTPPTPNLTTSPLPFPTLGPVTSDDQGVFSIEVNGTAILLKP